MKDLKALFWKEWHENARWALLILLCLSVSLVYAVYYETGRTPYSNAGAIPLWDTVNLILTIGAPLAGLSLGLLQILPELRRDQWAFLVHRPITRTALFFGKVIPGLCLYILAISLPLLGFAAWDAAPGHVAAPFDIRFTLNGWAIICFGLVFYFAGLLVALRPARWYGSRGLPLLGALLVLITAGAWNEFWQAVLVGLLISAVLAAAAWGSFVASGDYGSMTKPTRFMLGITLYVGSIIGVFALTALSMGISNTLFPKPVGTASNKQYQIDIAGHIRVFAYDHGEETTTDLLGNIVDRHRVVGNEWSGNSSEQFLNFSDFPIALQNSPLRSQFSSLSRYALPLQTFLYHSDDTAWYYLYRTNQIVGYSLHSRQRVGYLGPNGFSQSSEAAGAFSEPLGNTEHLNNTTALLLFPHSVYRFDTIDETLIRLWSGSSANALEGFTYLAASPKIQNYAIAEGNQIQVFSGQNNLLFTLPRPFPTSVYPVVQAAMNPQGSRYYFWYAPKNSILPSLGFFTSKLVTVTAEGHIRQTTSLPALTPPPDQDAWPRAIGLLVPPGFAVASTGLIGISSAVGDIDAKQQLKSLYQDMALRGLLALSVLSGLVAALLAWRISRRCGDSRRGQIMWAFGVFWLGGYGVLLLLALRAWPARVPCPNCGRLRVVDRSTCEHCGALFARPQQDGTEIFEEAAAR